MQRYREIAGDLILYALQGEFDVITHGCNIYNTMGAGITVPMKKTFNCNNFPMELKGKGDYNKLGNIDFQKFWISEKDLSVYNDETTLTSIGKRCLYVVNSYTQAEYKSPAKNEVLLDYDALTLCLRKINKIFKGKHIGLPKIGCGLAGGNWRVVKKIILRELKDCKVTVVVYGK